MDSIKQYNLAGVASTVELGKRGSKIVSSADQVSLTDNAERNLINAEIADGTESTHAVTKSQFTDASKNKLQDYDIQVNFDSGEVNLGSLLAGGTVLRVSVEKGAGNWVGTTVDTDITVGTSADNSLLFGGFDPFSQSHDETNHTFAEDSDIKIFVTDGGATAGSAVVRIVFAGIFTPAE